MTAYSTVMIASDRPRQLLASLLALRTHAAPDEVIIVSIGSQVDLTGIVKLSQLPVTLIRLPVFTSRSAALNSGLDAATHDIVLILGSHVALENDPAHAISYLEDKRGIGILGAKLFNSGPEPRRIRQIGYHIGQGRIHPQPIGYDSWDIYHEPLAVDAANCACMLIRRTDLRFDERYWYQLDDVDFSLQYQQRNLNVVMLPDLQAARMANETSVSEREDVQWAARRLASYWLYHQRWCSDIPLKDLPYRRAIRGETARQHLENSVATLVGAPTSEPVIQTDVENGRRLSSA